MGEWNDADQREVDEGPEAAEGARPDGRELRMKSDAAD